ncbi:MAG: hypothetical protein K9L77_01845 [Candidatus Omnitrophica bacterium]|nr:hypothetical protein [Candidatus Omnitrophota bacterium]
MIQKIQKAQALSEMALFGSIILLCFYYLLTYLQRVDRQQYLLQESFRSALKMASNPANGSVAYNIFSNRRQVSINSPLIGERSQLSGAGQVYWGAVEYELPPYDPAIHGGEDGEDYGPEVVDDLESKQYYRFNKDELDLTDNLKIGTVTMDELSEFTSAPDDLWDDLVNNGYIDGNGNILDAFTDLEDSSDLELDNEYEDNEGEELTKFDICNFLESEQMASPEVDITSNSDRDSSTTITYGDSNISSQSRAGEKDTVTYTLTAEETGGAIYTISQGLDTDGEYSQAAVGTKVYNVMREGNEDLNWTVSK